VSKRFLVVNAILVGIALFLAADLFRSLTLARPLPPAPAPRQGPAASPAAPEGNPPAVTAETLANYNVIATKHLFNPSRSESSAVAATPPAPPPPPKPTLMGVVLDGPESRAYLKEATTERVLSYKIGDTVSGGRLDKITDDMVVIVRPDGPVEVMLRDPTKPKPPPPAPTAATGPPAAGTQPPGPATQPPGTLRPPPALAAPPAAPTPPAAVTLPDNQAVGRGRGGGGGRGR
jgi:type II secretion system (T2SS) protein C